MIPKLYGMYRSPWVRLAAAVLHEKQVPFELIPVDLPKGAHKTPEYLAKHPFGQTPYIDDDGFILYESKAICYYIAAKYHDQGTPLLPTTLQGRALYQQAVFVELSHFHSHALPIIREVFGKKKEGLTPDKEVVDRHVAEFGTKLSVYDKILSKQKYITGDEISLVDFYHLPVGANFAILGVDITEGKPHLARWIQDVSSRNSWVSTKPAEQ